MRRLIVCACLAVISCRELARPAAGVTGSRAPAPDCDPVGWWSLQLRTSRFDGAACPSEASETFPSGPKYTYPVEIQRNADGTLGAHDLFGQTHATFDASTCRLTAEMSTEKKLVKAWEGGELLWRELINVLEMQFEGSAVHGTLTFATRVSRPACHAPCDLRMEFLGTSMAPEAIESFRRELDLEQKRQQRQREHPTQITPEEKEALLGPIRKQRGPGSCWSLDED